MILEFPPFRLDTVNQCLWRQNAPADVERIPLTPKEFAVLNHLVGHADRLVTLARTRSLNCGNICRA
jgi:DNA-binding response OmpR family regulator